MRNSLIVASAWCILAAVFAVDSFTPQNLTVAILLDVPIVIAALTRSRRLIVALIVAGLVCDALAGCIDAYRENQHWDHIGILNRLLSACSIALVGYLSTAVQERARSVGVIMARESRMRREIALSVAMERMRTLLSRELVERALIREATLLFHVAGASWLPAKRESLMLTIDGERLDVIEERMMDHTELTSLVQTVLDAMAPRHILQTDAIGRMVLTNFGRASGVALPVREGEVAYGVLVLWSSEQTVIDDDELVTARLFARSLATTLGRTELFAELAMRNDAIAERSAIIHDLVYALTHDLRTPLTALGVTMQQAREGVYGKLPERYERILEASVASIDDLQRLAETLLTVARIESGELRPSKHCVALHDMLADLVSEFAALARSRSVQLDLVCNGTFYIVADRGDIRRAVSNLIVNALEHTPAEGRVELELSLDERTVVLRVLDDGYGIPESEQGMLFVRFASLSSRTGRGTGLGLYIVRRIAEAASGSVAYAARIPRGSIFTLRFPSAPSV